MSDPISLPGLSGYDFSGIVSQMVDVYKLPEQHMIKAQDNLKVEKDAWREINTRLSALNNALLNLRLSATWGATKATSSNSSLLSASTTSSAVQGVYNIKIFNTAQAQTATSLVQNVADGNAATSVTAGSFKITVTGVEKTINVAAGDSLNTIAQSINNAKAGVTASVIKVDGGYKLAITSTKTGVENAASLSNVTGSVLQDLGILDAGNSLNISQGATDANITVNGIDNITSASNTISTAIPGITLNLNGSDGGVSTINLTVGADNSVAQKAVEDFIEKYNSAMEYISEKLHYDAETKEKGDLFADPILQGIQARLRRIVTSEVDNPTGPYVSLSYVGIKTVSAKDAKLTLDTVKFNQAQVDNAQSIANLFGAPSGGVTPSTNPASPQGVANILEAYLDPLVKFEGSIYQKQDSIDTQLRDLDERLNAFSDRVERYEDMLRVRFASLEALLSTMSQQSSWLTNQVAMMTKSSNS